MDQVNTSSIDQEDKLKVMVSTLRNARDFLSAFEVLRNHNRACMETGEEPVFIADISNLAFAIELLLKALLSGEGHKANGHNMEKLFQRLSAHKQCEIQNAFSDYQLKKYGGSPDPFHLGFEVRLRQYAKTYQYWRYFHESGRGTFHYQFCEDLAHVLNNIAQTYVNELAGTLVAV